MNTSLLLITQLFAAGSCDPNAKFLGVLPTWYKYLSVNSSGGICNVVFDPKSGSDWAFIALAILEILMRIGGMVALGYIIYGGIKYISSQGEPDRTREAQHTVANAIIGLVITILAVPLIGFIANKMG